MSHAAGLEEVQAHLRGTAEAVVNIHGLLETQTTTFSSRMDQLADRLMNAQQQGYDKAIAAAAAAAANNGTLGDHVRSLAVSVNEMRGSLEEAMTGLGGRLVRLERERDSNLSIIEAGDKANGS